MDILFVHQNFPGQFLHLARALKATPGLRLAVVTHQGNRQASFLPSARYAWEPKRAGAPAAVAANYAARASRGGMAAKAMMALRGQGFDPALVLGHLGWGETLFVKDVFPKARLAVYAEFYYAARGADVGFDPEFPASEDPERLFELRSRNASILTAMNDADIALVATPWQASRFPRHLQDRLTVAHDGIDTEAVRPDPGARYAVPGTGLAFRPGDEVLTFVNRNLEPYRGYHVFMRALPAILAARPAAHAVIVGGDCVSYGAAAPAGRSWKDIFLAEVRDRLPLDRVHFVGRVPFAAFTALMQVSAAHVYLTYPFVLSWSMLQAMSAGAPVIASATAPVLDVVQDGVNGLLVDFFAVDDLARRVVDVLARPDGHRRVREAGRRAIVDAYDLATVCLPRWRGLLGL